MCDHAAVADTVRGSLQTDCVYAELQYAERLFAFPLLFYIKASDA